MDHILLRRAREGTVVGKGLAMFKTILAATDGSDHATKAVGMAADLAAKYGARLVLIYVVQPGPLPETLRGLARAEHLAESKPITRPTMGGVPSWISDGLAAVDTFESDRKVFEAYANHILERARTNAVEAGAKPISTVVEIGDPADRILARAAEEGADLILIGTRGFGELKALLLGSVSHKVVQHATCCCLTVR